MEYIDRNKLYYGDLMYLCYKLNSSYIQTMNECDINLSAYM